MKRGNPNDDQRSSDRERKAPGIIGSVQERSAKERNSLKEDEETKIKNANASGQGAIGREEEKQIGNPGTYTSGLENEGIY